MLPKARCVHETPGRFRVKIPSKKGDAGYFAHLQESLARCPDVSSVRSNPTTASLLVSHNTRTGTVAAFAEENSLFTLDPGARAKSAPHIHQATLTAYRRVDAQVKRLSGGELDLLHTAYLTLLGTGAYQLARGRLRALPWYTALWYAMNLFMEAQRRKAKP